MNSDPRATFPGYLRAALRGDDLSGASRAVRRQAGKAQGICARPRHGKHQECCPALRGKCRKYSSAFRRPPGTRRKIGLSARRPLKPVRSGRPIHPIGRLAQQQPLFPLLPPLRSSSTTHPDGEGHQIVIFEFFRVCPGSTEHYAERLLCLTIHPPHREGLLRLSKGNGATKAIPLLRITRFHSLRQSP